MGYRFEPAATTDLEFPAALDDARTAGWHAHHHRRGPGLIRLSVRTQDGSGRGANGAPATSDATMAMTTSASPISARSSSGAVGRGTT